MPRGNDRKRAGGQFTTETTLAEVHEVLNEASSSSSPSLMTGEVAEELDISDESARQKLLSLHEEGQINRRKAGRQVLWWTEDERERPAVVDVTHDFRTGESVASFENGVVLTVNYQDRDESRGFVCELTHPQSEKKEEWSDRVVERPPGEVLVETLADYYHAEAEERKHKVPHLDAFMQEVLDDE